ncbi:MAG: response regulator [Zoogloeaceae bacterium]|jgi:PAS domain S-box-containing protein|nr:response regulator [Zoogloeaceae bacterium]
MTEALELEAEVARLHTELTRTRAELRDILGANNSIAAALFRSEERLRLIIDTIPAQISYFDQGEIYRYANKGYSNWFDLPRSEVIGSPIVRVIGEESYHAIRPYIARALAGETVTHEHAIRKNGTLVDARSTLVPEIGSDGAPVGCFEFSFDITDTRRMQAALAQAQKMEAIGQLTGGVAHDFNNLLTIISGNLSLLQEGYSDHRDVRELAEPALRAAKRGAQLVRSLLSFSRQQPLQPVVVNVRTLMTDMEPLIRHSLPSSIQFCLQLADEALSLCVDPGQLESALLNFALNARDAMPAGGRLEMRAHPVVIDAQQAREDKIAPGAYVRIEVSDTGCGMNEATKSKVFDPFFTTKGFGRGSGLGLSMIYGFAHQSGGCVRVESAPGKGSLFTLILPPAAAGALEEIPPEEQTPVKDATPDALVLLVEDDPDVRRVVRHQLVELGYPVLEAENGNQAVEFLTQVDAITILLTDIIMPGGMSGRELARNALRKRPELHVVLMSGYEEQAALGKAETPDLHLLGKPFSKQELARALKSSLEYS